MIKGFLWLLWGGIVEMSKKDRRIMMMYAVLFGLLFLSGVIFQNIMPMFMIIFVTALVLGLVHFFGYVLPSRKKQENFNRIFEEIGLKAESGTPQFLSTNEISRFITAYSFKTYLPLKMWLAKKDHLEMHMNEKIVGIKQSPINKNIISVHIASAPLPNLVHLNGQYSNKSHILNIGLSYYGTVGMNLERTPHAFVAGETGSGKSNLLKCWIEQALYHKHEVVLIDFKRGVSFYGFKDKVAVYYDYQSIIAVLRDMVSETISRLDKFRGVGVDNYKDYSKIAGEYLPRKIIFIDELAELLRTRDKELSSILYDSIESLARLSMAVGIHLIMGIQRPDSTIISGQIKNNVSFRVCGRFVDREPSRIMLGTDIANILPNIKGRFIVKDDEMCEVQSFFFSKEKAGYQKPRQDVEETGAKQEPIILLGDGKAEKPRVTPPTEQVQETDTLEKFDFSEFRK